MTRTKINVGEKFKFKGYEWVALEVNEDNVVAIMTKAWDTAEFDVDRNNRNNWETSTVRKRLQEELLPELGEENLITRSVDLVADNGDRRYGRTDDKIWLLSCDDFRKWREIILENCDFDDGWWWTLTPWYIPDAWNGGDVCIIHPAGYTSRNSAYRINGVAPACVFRLSSLTETPSDNFMDDVRAHLAAYEDTGLTPDQIRQMDQFYRERCEELERYKTAIAEAAKGEPYRSLYYDEFNHGWDRAMKLILSMVE